MRSWTTSAPKEGKAYLIFLRPLVYGFRWMGYVYRPDHWPALVASGWVRARESVQEDPQHGAREPLARVSEERKN